VGKKMTVILVGVLLSLALAATSAYAHDGTIRPNSMSYRGGSQFEKLQTPVFVVQPLHDGTIRPD